MMFAATADRPRRSPSKSVTSRPGTANPAAAVTVEPLEGRTLMSAAAPAGHHAAVAHGPAVNDPRIFAPGEKVRGETVAQLGAEWWQWALSFQVGSEDAPTSPLFDQTGEVAHVGDVGKVFFLAGLIDLNDDTPLVADATRDIRLPTGTPVFFPVINSYADNVGFDQPYSVQGLFDLTTDFLKTTNNLHLTLDGKPIAVTDAFRVQSGPFDYVLPQTDNYYQHFGYNGADGRGLVSPAVSDGWWVALKPLAPGNHTLNFGGAIPAAGFSIDLTYHIQVVPQGQYNKNPAAPPVFSNTPVAKAGRRLADALLC